MGRVRVFAGITSRISLILFVPVTRSECCKYHYTYLHAAIARIILMHLRPSENLKPAYRCRKDCLFNEQLLLETYIQN